MSDAQEHAEEHAQVPDATALAAVARELGDLLLVEVDGQRLARLQGLRGALADVGVEVPGSEVDLDELAADYNEAFVRPTGGGAPPVASLWIEGRFEGRAAARMRELGESAALTLDRGAARDAPIDHLGCILHLWAAGVTRAPWVARELGERWLTWVDAPLRRVEARGGFYAGVAGAVRALCVELEDGAPR